MLLMNCYIRNTFCLNQIVCVFSRLTHRHTHTGRARAHAHTHVTCTQKQAHKQTRSLSHTDEARAGTLKTIQEYPTLFTFLSFFNRFDVTETAKPRGDTFKPF